MAASIGAEMFTVEPTEEELVNALEDVIWHVEQPISTLHGTGKILLSKFVRAHGYKVWFTLARMR